MFSVERMAAIVDTQMDTLGISRAHVVGHSLGGCVALALALDAPARVRSLVVVNSFARLRPSGLRAAVRSAGRLTLSLAAPMSVVAAYVAREAFPRPEQAGLRQAAIERVAANPRRHYLASLAAILRFDVRRRLGEIRCPTLIVAGANDRTVPLAAKELLAGSIPGAGLRVVADSGHVSQFDQPVAFNRLLIEHLDRLEALGEDSAGIPTRK